MKVPGSKSKENSAFGNSKGAKFYERMNCGFCIFNRSAIFRLNHGEPLWLKRVKPRRTQRFYRIAYSKFPHSEHSDPS